MFSDGVDHLPVLMVRLIQLIWPFRKAAQWTLASSGHVEQLGSNGTDFREILYLGAGSQNSPRRFTFGKKNEQK